VATASRGVRDPRADHTRRAEAVALFEGFIEHNAKRTSSAGSYRIQAIETAGDFFRERGWKGKARDTYLRAYQTDKVTSQFLYLSLAELDVELGQRKRAKAIYGQLVKYYLDIKQ
jgi:hypothetical protein